MDNKNWLGAFLQYLVPRDKRTPNHIGMRRNVAIPMSGGRAPGAFGNPKRYQSFDPRITNSMRIKILREKAVATNEA